MTYHFITLILAGKQEDHFGVRPCQKVELHDLIPALLTARSIRPGPILAVDRFPLKIIL
jgi:hypothetical protein